MAVIEIITLGFTYCSWLNIFGFILLPCLIPEAAARCGCESGNRVLSHGFYSPTFNNIPVAGDAYKAQTQELHSNSNNAGQRHALPNYRILQFQPTYLDFQKRSVGMPAMQTVSIFNPNSENSLQILSISRTSDHFHTSFLLSKSLLPLTNATFEVVFLARVIGNVENTIYVNTNKGNFPFQVFGTGVPNPYRLRSFLGARIPLDAIFSPYINIYNPYGSNLQVTEVYSSGGELHLELPSGHSTEATQKIWEIPPYETKPAMKVTFRGRVLGNYSGFVRVKTGKPVAQSEVVILPFEVEVASARGIYTNIDLFDFGTLRTMDESKSLSLNLMNYGNKTIHINSISVVPPNKAININFSPLVLKANRPFKKVASITYTALHSVHRRQNSGKIVIDGSSKSKRRQFRLEVPYRANVLQGTLAYSVTKTAFFAADALFTPKIQPLTITNTFNFSLIIYNASLPKEVSHIFSIVNFTQPRVVRPGKLVSPLSLRFQSNHSELVLYTILRLYTNASIFTIPVHSYSGKLKYIVDGSEPDVIDYGTVGVKENRTITFKIINSNPVEVSIKEYSCNSNIELVRLRLVHIRQGKKPKHSKKSKWVRARSNMTSHNSTSMLKEQITLRPREEATFSVDLTAPSKECTFQGEVTFKTGFEELHIPMYLKSVVGSLLSRPKRISFENSFPGQKKSHTLYFESTFHHPLLITDLKLHPPDSRFRFAWPSEGIPELKPHVKTKIGWIRFDPFHGTEAQCYLCLCQLDPGCLEWIRSLSLPGDTWELDLRLLEKLKSKWQAVKESQETRINSSLVVNSEIVKGYSIPIQASLTWPAIVEQSIRFPPTHVGNYTIQELVLNNPADVPVLVQVMPLLDYPHPQGALDLVSDRLEVDSFSIELNGHSSFFLPDLNSNEKDHSYIQSKFGVTPSALTLLLKQRAKTVVNIGFLPDDEKLKTSIMVVRNNLTVLDLVVVQGEGARGRFNINGKAPGTNSALQFELKASHLADCNKSTAKARTFPSFTVKKTFTASNTGQLPVHVLSMNINGYECDGYGFRILNCEPFVLQPNTSRKVDVTFTPDFTTSRITRTLHVVTSMDPSLEFTLIATLPHRLLPLCSSAIPRPIWEPYLHMAAAVLMSTVFVVVIFLAYFDAQKYIFKCTFGASGGTIRVSKVPEVFDLNAIVGTKQRLNNKGGSPGSKSNERPSAKLPVLHMPTHVQKKKSNENNYATTSRSRSSSFCSTNSDSSRNSSLSTPSPDILNDVRIEPERKDPVETDVTYCRRPKKKVSSSNGYAHNNEGKSIDNDSHRQGRQRKIEKQSRQFLRNMDDRPKPETPVSNVVIQEVSILDVDDEKPCIKDQKGNSKRKSKITLSKKEKESEQSKQQPAVVKATSNGAKQLSVENEIVNHEFIKVESKAAQKSRKTTKPDNPPMYSCSESLDKLDEISISGPKPDARDTVNLQKSSKLETSKGKESSRQKRKSSQTAPNHGKILYDANGKVIFDTPTSPHAIAAAVVEAALEKSLGSKHRKGRGKLEKAASAGSTPTSPGSLSGSSRSSSYSSIVSNDGINGAMWRLGTGGYSPSSSRKGSPSPLHLDGAKHSSGRNSPVLNEDRRDSAENESWSSYLRRLAIGIHPSPATVEKKPENSNSMFYYDHLSSMRASKKPLKEDEDRFRRAPGSKPWPHHKRPAVKSNLDPDSAEFIPKSLRSQSLIDPFLNTSSDPMWPIGTKSKAVRPPPGLNRTKRIADIWGIDDMVIGSESAARFNLDLAKREKTNATLYSNFGDQERSYSALVKQSSADQSSDLFDTLCGAFDSSPADVDTDPWMLKGGFPIENKENTWPAPGIQPSIWSTDRSLPPSESQFSRSLLGLDLSLPSLSPTKEKFADDSPMDPLSIIWDPSDDSLDVPYEGWSEDIKEE